MQYIIGTKIIVPASKASGRIKPGMSSAQIRALSRRSSTNNTHLEKMKPGVEYTLARIYTEHERIMYKFVSSTDICILDFDSVSEAEKFISETRGESLTDYQSVYRDMTD